MRQVPSVSVRLRYGSRGLENVVVAVASWTLLGLTGYMQPLYTDFGLPVGSEDGVRVRFICVIPPHGRRRLWRVDRLHCMGLLKAEDSPHTTPQRTVTF